MTPIRFTYSVAAIVVRSSLPTMAVTIHVSEPD